MSIPVKAKISMYRMQELGDCFLLQFTAGQDTSRMLIDCGTFRNGKDSIKRIKDVAADIRASLNGRPLDVVVGTHQHNDHVNGFVHAEAEFRQIGARQVWLSWLDDSSDARAKVIGEKYHNLKKQITAVRDSLHANVQLGRSARPGAKQALVVLDDIMGFYGTKQAGSPAVIPEKGVSILKSLGQEKPLYLKPGRILDMPGLPSGTVKVHVLGPPRTDDLLYRKDPREGESYDHELAATNLQASRFLAAAEGHNGNASHEDEHYPFKNDYKLRKPLPKSPLEVIMRRYRAPASKWRSIDDDWMEQAGSLALFLDTFTNNSSLVLAIELVDSQKVLLFAADAQTGNWLSWKGVKWDNPAVSTDDLLARTVFYKVGHHASHNATLVEAFEKMNHPDLVALIPVDKTDPNITKLNGWKMPASNLFKKLIEHTDHRVLQMDNTNPPNCNPDKNPAKAAWQKVGIKPKVTDLSVEIEIKG